MVAGANNNYISPGGDGPIGTLRIGSTGGLTLNNLSTMRFDIQSTSSLDQINDAGSLGFSSASGAAIVLVPGGSGQRRLSAHQLRHHRADQCRRFLAGSHQRRHGRLFAVPDRRQQRPARPDRRHGRAPSGGTWNFNGNGSWAASSNWSTATAPSSGTVTFAGVPGQPPLRSR